VQAALSVAEKLRWLGSQVYFLGPEAARTMITNAGYDFESHPLFDIYRFSIGVGRRPSDLARLVATPSLLIKAVQGYREEGRHPLYYNRLTTIMCSPISKPDHLRPVLGLLLHSAA
jgi:hypothetical protein